ncbi:hypothetical protein [Rubrivirga marina]|uniref:Uncharacterized protein n=1 Tax=Rubrivirga marina TaxID=1196024 RepID=A0A271IYP1_9BACT|nr:hypothetical protein [Rubrivirga marina]PAP75639.1 hypothetical protein BSZ37_03910 [Rubrivirga marina]
MATFDRDPGVPFPHRMRAFADALEAEGRPTTAAHVRAAVDTHEMFVAEGRLGEGQAHLVRALTGFVPARVLKEIEAGPHQGNAEAG